LAILTQVADSLRVASLHGVDVVIYPELFLTGGHSSQQQCEQSAAFDREDTKFNIISNICEELNVSCIIGYAESIHKSELKSTSNIDDDKRAYNSIMAVNACGTRSGNYRSISKQDHFRSGHPFVESTPMLLQLPNRNTSNGEDREMKVGLMCGINDMLCPEHCRNLVSSGAQILVASTSFTNTKFDTRVVECIVPTRAMENQVPFLFANYESKEEKMNEGDLEFVGSSAIVSKIGDYLVCAPQHEGGDMPIDTGYLIPCEVGALYAADINIEPTSNTDSNDQWDLKARMPDELLGQQSNKKKQAIGFGNISSKRKAKKLKP